jgi:hypothetical protein
MITEGKRATQIKSVAPRWITLGWTNAQSLPVDPRLTAQEKKATRASTDNCYDPADDARISRCSRSLLRADQLRQSTVTQVSGSPRKMLYLALLESRCWA